MLSASPESRARWRYAEPSSRPCRGGLPCCAWWRWRLCTPTARWGPCCGRNAQRAQDPRIAQDRRSLPRAFREFQAPTGIDRPAGIAIGPEGDIWFTETRSSSVGRMTPSGKFKMFQLAHTAAPPASSSVRTATSGSPRPTASGGSPPAGKITEFPIPATEIVFPPPSPAKTAQLPLPDHRGPGRQPLVHRGARRQDRADHPERHDHPVPDPHGGQPPVRDHRGPGRQSLVHGELGDKIGRITPSGTVTEFPVPTANGSPYGITTGPDGNLWFTEGRQQDRPDHPERHDHRVPDSHSPSAPPSGITAGRDGNLWFTEEAAGKIGRITPSGQISEFSVPTPESQPDGITATPRRQHLVHRALRQQDRAAPPRALAMPCSQPEGEVARSGQKALV